MKLILEKNDNPLDKSWIEIEVPEPTISWQKSNDILPPELQFGDPESTLVGLWSVKDSSVIPEFVKVMDNPLYWPFHEYGQVISDSGIVIIEGTDLIIVEINQRFDIIHIL